MDKHAETLDHGPTRYKGYQGRNGWMLYVLQSLTKSLSIMLLLSVLATLSAFALFQGHADSTKLPPTHITYSTITGYFAQDDPATNSSTFDYTSTNFGLLNRTYLTDPRRTLTQWQRFKRQLSQLQHDAPKGVKYKLLYLGRHGEGYHNAAESYYGTPAWNCYWSIRDGNGTTSWADAKLTSNGVAQAEIANKFWAKEIAVQKVPTPQSYYTSPLTRCLATAEITFTGLNLPARHPFVPEVKEFLREGISGHTCDRRGTRTYIHESFPSYKIEAGFTETDELFQALRAETPADQDARSKIALDDIFNHDHDTYISITSHSGEIASILRVIGHRVFSLRTGAVMPVLVRAETVVGAVSVAPTEPYSPICTCTSSPPVKATTSTCVTATATVGPQ